MVRLVVGCVDTCDRIAWPVVAGRGINYQSRSFKNSFTTNQRGQNIAPITAPMVFDTGSSGHFAEFAANPKNR